MSMQIFSPVGEPETFQQKDRRPLRDASGARVGFVFNQHTSALSLWKLVEQEVADQLKPAATHRLYKTNTWAPAPQADIERLMRETDFAVVGVGA